MKTHKSILSAVLVLLLMFSFSLPLGCAKKASGNEQGSAAPHASSADDPADSTEASARDKKVRVLNIDYGGSSGMYGRHGFDAEEGVIESYDESKAKEAKTLDFAGNHYELEYLNTYYYTIGNYTVDYYSVKGHEYNAFLFPDGRLKTLVSDPIITIEIDPHAAPEEARRAVENALGDEIDFSLFEYCDVKQGAKTDPDSGFFSYTILWYNKKGDIMTDGYVQIKVHQDGDISIVKLPTDCKLDSVPDDIRFDDYVPAMEEKLDEIYGEELVSYDLTYCMLTNYGGTPGIFCYLDVYLNSGYDEPLSEICELVILPEP
ncbi:MAG: hypothetical protein IJM18_02435 [Clostridia bacterium]|nr:hypothetical protein [Clostridia bacterium]